MTHPFANLSLGTKGILVVAIPICALLAAMAVFYQFEEQSRQAQGLVEHTFEVRSEIRHAITLLADSETAIRGYLLSSRPGFLDNFLSTRGELPQPLANLRRLAADNPRQSQRLDRIDAILADQSQALQLLPNERGEAQRESILNSISAGAAGFRGLLAEMQAEEEGLLTARTQRARDSEQRVRMAIFFGGAIGLLGGVFVALIFSTGIVRRVQQLEHGARAMAAGQTIESVPEGEDEIARLGRTMRDTSQTLAHQAADLHRIRAELETGVESRTSQLGAAVEELRQANEERMAIVQSAPVAIWAIDLEGNAMLWNRAAEAIFGWAQTELLGKPLPVIPEDLREEYGGWLESFRTGETINGEERRRVTKDGRTINVLIWTAPLRDSAGKVRGTIAIDSDISQHRLLEEQFRQAQKMEAVGRLAGGVAHDFNNLLTVITGYTEMLLSETQDEFLIEYGKEIQNAAGRATALTTQLLAFSRRQIVKASVIDLNDVVGKSMKMLRRVIGEDIQVTSHLDARLGRIKADPTQIDQILINLVVNARDAMGAGGKITIETGNQVLDREYAGRHLNVKPGQYCMLAVSDTGIGMTAEVQSRLFEPFFTTKEAGKGTGLGLSIVYGIVKQNTGEIMVYSEPGNGTTFKIYFPMVETSEEQPHTQASQVQRHGTETILVCEDEEHIRKLVRAMLVKFGYRVIDADTPHHAIEIARRDNQLIHLLLTDVVMPDMNGFELANSVREIRPGIRVMYMSGYTDNRVQSTWTLDADTPFIQKPFTAESLTEKVREALGNGASAKET